MRGRGLKLNHDSATVTHWRVAPRAGARIETFANQQQGDYPARSPPVRGRGLKHLVQSSTRSGYSLSSPPVRGRGLKLNPGNIDLAVDGVAPRAGARIETSYKG